MHILALWVPVAGTYGCLKGLGFGRLEGRWKGRGHTRVPLGEGTFGARLGPACIQGHLLNQLHLLPFPSPPSQQCNKSFTYLFEPLILMSALSRKLDTCHDYLLLVLYSKCASCSRNSSDMISLSYHSVNNFFPEFGLSLQTKQICWAEHQRFQRWSFFSVRSLEMMMTLLKTFQEH